ncbi:hypothetical protein BO71DRAFT_455086 [Aspergillus ellipticus CBS 707.79]|uniref:C2H2-type domain-containing protein n=1 Tax=Aspergillus ellipticus CBS 707.79 TaxID=1448320 RepID=A0A319DR46_9EURO|nr:hypothetical protein BO71DRAFT_455086 [Aspergillus ellipticus CBS 707.79]
MKAQDSMSHFTQVVDLAEHNNSEIKRVVLPRTEAKYERALQIFDKFIELHPRAVDPPDIQSYKAFMEFFGRNTKGRLGEKPTVGTAEDFRRDYEAGMSKIRKHDFPDYISTTIKEWIPTELKDKIGLSTVQMEKDGLSLNDLTVLLTQLWCRDFKEYRGEPPDRTRVQLSAAMLLYCFTSARTGEVHESTARRAVAREHRDNGSDNELEAQVLAACYKHYRLTIESVGARVLLVLTYQREYLKDYWRKQRWELPIHAFYDVYKEDMPLVLNFLTFFLPMASADGVFRDYSSVSEVLDAVDSHDKHCPSENQILEVIHFNDCGLEIPVFRQFDELDVKKSTGKARGADAFGKAFVELGHRSGYTHNITARACRRWALMEADKKYSKTARMKFAGHENHRTFGKSYAHPACEVDGPATYLGIASRHEHIQNRRGMGMYHNTQLWQSLPAKAEFKFQERSDIITLNSAIENLSFLLIYNEKTRLYVKELKRLQRSQPNTLNLSKVIQDYAREKTLFHYRRRVMPERDYLATILPQRVGLRSCEGRKALQALESLCKSKCSIAYLTSLQPLDEKCICREPIKKYSEHKFAKLCFECDKWFNDPRDWEDHCQGHLQRPAELLRCDPLIFRNAPVKPGYCPFCLGDTTRSFSCRMEHHIEGHLNRIKGNFFCGHPACSVKFENLNELRHHLTDVHCYQPPRGQKRKRNESSSE